MGTWVACDVGMCILFFVFFTVDCLSSVVIPSSLCYDFSSVFFVCCAKVLIKLRQCFVAFSFCVPFPEGQCKHPLLFYDV